MKLDILYLSIVSIVLILATSCEQDDLEGNHPVRGSTIKSTVSDGRVVSMFKYNQRGEISEWQGLHHYVRYLYDSEGRLTKQESAIDSSVFSAGYVEKTALMTSENSTISGYQTFSYATDGKLAKLESYFKKDGNFVRASIGSFEYEGEHIARVNLHNEEGQITQFSTYEYDNRGNVRKENYYAHQPTGNPTLISELTFEYDDKKNPFSVFKALGNPGIYTNTNNVTKVYSVSHEDATSTEGRSTLTTYFYNQYGYPIKVISDNSESEYAY